MDGGYLREDSGYKFSVLPDDRKVVVDNQCQIRATIIAANAADSRHKEGGMLPLRTILLKFHIVVYQSPNSRARAGGGCCRMMALRHGNAATFAAGKLEAGAGQYPFKN